ncbi:hypothetical protein AK830_g8655, partial [Neonectria ditissima]
MESPSPADPTALDGIHRKPTPAQLPPPPPPPPPSHSEPMTAPVLDGAEPALAETHGAPLSDLHLKLWHLFARAAEAYPAHEALVSLWQPQDHRPGESVALRWSYAELRARAEALAASLAAEGCRPGMRLCVVLGNSAEWALFFWAAARLQMAFAPVDPTVAADARAMVLSVRPSVVVAQDGDGAAALDLVQAASLLQGPGLRIHCAAQEVEGWTRLCDVPASEHVVVAVEESPSLAESPSLTANPNQDDDNDNTNNTNNTNDDAAALIIFTSGTTGEPKGCPHTNRNLVSESCDFDPEVDPSVFLRWLVHTPASHIFAVNNALRAWRFGGAVVFPSRAFAVDATLHALVAERCSVMSATPTLVKALLAHPAFPGPGGHLRIVTIGGTAVGPADIQLCRRGLGAGAAIQVYGMSEGAPLVTFARTDPDLVDGYHPGVGKVLPGAAARVCRPGSRDVLRRGEVGELHVGGTSIITGYYGRGPDESMYRDAAGPWLATGDQASIDEQGVVYILGRYKDLIIRGGENIYPIRIESSLQELPGAHVVGVPDDFAGQVPVAVAILPEGTTKAQLIEKSRASDPRHALDAVYTLGDLGLDKFPVTSLGKVKKETLRQKLANLRQPEPPTPETQPAQKYTEKLLRIWEKLSGVRPAASDSVTFLADSITLLRYCDGVLRACGQRLYLQDFAEHDTVEKQAQLLLAREMQQARLAIAQPGHEASAAPVQQLHTSLVARRDRDGHSVDEADVWSAAQARVASVGLAVVDVEDVMAVRDSLHRTAIGLRPQSYHNRMVFRVRGLPYAQIRRGLERALASRPMLRAVVFEASNRAPFHAVLTPSPALFDKLIHHVQVDTEEEATQLSQDDSAEGHSSPFMFQSDLMEIAATDQHLLSFTFNHSVIDALSITQWHHELDRWLQDANVEIPALTPYRLFSDLFTQYQDSEPARRSVAFHVTRLRGISRFRRALWPPQRAPDMLISNDAGCPRAEERRAARDAVWA